MKKHRIRKLFVYLLLAFLIFLYIFSMAVMVFGDPKAGLVLFAYSTFFSILVYFFILAHKRSENKQDDAKDTDDSKKTSSSTKLGKKDKN